MDRLDGIRGECVDRLGGIDRENVCGQTGWYMWGESVDRLGGIGGESVWTDLVV